jgi:hypothetical protein
LDILTVSGVPDGQDVLDRRDEQSCSKTQTWVRVNSVPNGGRSSWAFAARWSVHRVISNT